MAASKRPAVILAAAAAVLFLAAMLPAQEMAVPDGGAKVSGAVAIETPAADEPAVKDPFGDKPETQRPGSSGHSSDSSGTHPKRPEPPDTEKKDSHDPNGEKEKKNGENEHENKEGENKEGENKEQPKAGSSDPVTRPTDPSEPPDPAELELKPDAEGKVRLNFRGQSWPDVIQWLADVSQLSLDWLEIPGGYLDVTTQRSYTLDEARDLINRHLLARGYTLLRNGEILTVVKIEKLNPSMVPRVEPEELADRDPHEFVKVSFLLDWMMASAAVEELKPMMSSHGKLTPMTATNRMEAIDVVINLRDIHALLTREQSSRARESLLREFPLQHTRASEVREQLAELLGLQLKSGPPRPVTPQQKQQAMQQAQEQARRMAEMQKQQAKSGGSPRPKTPGNIHLVANRRRNSILALAPPDKMVVIEQAIKMIDVPSDHTHSLLRNKDRMQVYFLESLQPGPLIQTLEELGDMDFDTRLEADETNNAVIAYASLADHMTIRTLIEKLDGGGRRAEVIQLEILRAESMVRIIDFMMGGGRDRQPKKKDNSDRNRFFFPFFGGRESSNSGKEQHSDMFRVDADAKNNSLLLWCNEFELAKVQNLLENLRQNQRAGDNPNTVRIHRLETLDAEPFVQTLQEMDTLDFHTTLKVDAENNAIIAYASEADHATIRKLLETLDGSSRQFHVITLRRLEADYVSGTISFMMAGKDDKQQSGYSRTYYYSEYYGGGGSSRNKKEKKPDEFRVDADVEFNRLLLWANESELKEVENLLVKLGEIPPEGGDPRTTRVIDVLPGPEQQELLEHIRRIWPSLAPNPLLMPPTEDPTDEEPTDEEPAEEENQPSDPPQSTPDDSRTTMADDEPARSIFRLAILQQEVPQEEPSEQTPPQPTSQDDAPAKATEPAPPQPPSDNVPGDPAENPPPVSITQGPDGRLIITSEDTKALDQLEALMTRLAPRRKDYEIFQLKYAEAYWVAWNLKDFFKEEDSNDNNSRGYGYGWYGYSSRSGQSNDSTRRLSKRKVLKFISDDDTNTILVQGADPAQLKTIQELIDLYDKPHLADSESARRTELFQIRYSQATVIAEAVKEVYRDLLSARDKALAKQPDKPKPESRYTYIYGSSGDSSALEKRPKFKGLLSIGIDQLSNTLIISAPESLFRDVSKMVLELDEAAKPVGVVRVIKVPATVNSDQLRKTLSEVLGGGSSRGKTPAKKPPGPPPGQANRAPFNGQGR